MQPNLLDILLIIFGLYYLYGVVRKPDFYWQRGRIQRTREIIGDRNTQVMYLAVGLIMLGVGIAGMFGMF